MPEHFAPRAPAAWFKQESKKYQWVASAAEEAARIEAAMPNPSGLPLDDVLGPSLDASLENLYGEAS